MRRLMQVALVCAALCLLPVLLDHLSITSASATPTRPLTIDQRAGAPDSAPLNTSESQERRHAARLNGVCPPDPDSVDAPRWSLASPQALTLPLCGFIIHARQTLLLAHAPPS